MVREVFLCETYFTDKTRRLSASPKFHEGLIACGFRTEDYAEALAHVDLSAGGNLLCWIESHEDGDLNKPVLREMHGSGMGGVYVNDYREDAA